jgi:hypothetical protein
MLNGPRPKTVKALPAAVVEPAITEEDAHELEDDAGTQAEESPERKMSPARRSEVTRVEVLGELRFDDVSPTLKDFCAQKNPSSDYKKYLVIAYWFKHYKQMPEINVNHIHTAYRLMGWATPKAAAQPLRDMKRSKMGWLSKGKEKGAYTINHVGENEVNALGSSG